ncbi:hypothetical protein CPC08DRAFT_704866 [Agrocybe pediades]|nr:hypothetical protein CPC08DRAFT_704866 [Agrocybe pediades]
MSSSSKIQMISSPNSRYPSSSSPSGGTSQGCARCADAAQLDRRRSRRGQGRGRHHTARHSRCGDSESRRSRRNTVEEADTDTIAITVAVVEDTDTAVDVFFSGSATFVSGLLNAFALSSILIVWTFVNEPIHALYEQCIKWSIKYPSPGQPSLPLSYPSEPDACDSVSATLTPTPPSCPVSNV